MHTARLIIICVFAAIGFAGCVLAAMLIYVGWKIEQVEQDRQDARDAKERMAEGGTITFEEMERELEIQPLPQQSKGWPDPICDSEELRRRVRANTLKLTGVEVIGDIPKGKPMEWYERE